MIFKWLYMFLAGYVNITVEGFFVERFINICISKRIILLDLHREKSTILKAKVIKSDFKKIRHVAKKTKCRVKLDKKIGVPFILNKYKKRKVFAIAIGVIAIFIFVLTRFIWNIEIEGLEKIPEEDILSTIKSYGIDKGKLKSSIDIDEITNSIRLERNDLSWVGIKIKGTNAIITVVESKEKPEIIDKNKICNIVSNKNAVISKIIVQNGTARISVGDEVKEGDLLVEGIMEGKYTGIRYVHAEADIYAKTHFEKEKKEAFIQDIDVKTGNEEKKYEIYINNFKINFNKGVSNFENYDTIRANKKIKLFSNYYVPINFVKITNSEIKKEKKEYTKEELKDKIEKELTEELDEEIGISNFEQNQVEKKVLTQDEPNGINVKVIYEIQEKIGTKEELVY